METKDRIAAGKFLALHKYVKRCALMAVPVPDYVEDIIQQVFVEFMDKAEQWDLEGDLKPLLAKMTHHVAGRFWRERSKTLPPMLEKVALRLRLPMNDSSSWTAETVERDNETFEQELKALHICLERLPDKSRDLIHSYYFDEIGSDEIARHKNIRVNSVCRAIWRIREKLRICITQILQKESHHVR